MGKIMMNGKQYGVGGIERAEDISYDNTSSGMSATNVQGALDEVKSGLTPVAITVTKSSKLTSDSAIWCRRMGKLVIVEFFIHTASACARGDVLATFDLPSNFNPNYFSGVNNGATTYAINLSNNTKTLTADGSISSGAVFSGQIVGFIS